MSAGFANQLLKKPITRRSIVEMSAGVLACSFISSSSPASAAAVDPKSAAEQFLYCTVRVDGTVPDGIQRGTGFIFGVNRGRTWIPLLITNNHVIRGTTSTSFRVHTKSASSTVPDGNTVIAAPDGSSNLWTAHPDPNVDMCALPLAPLLNSVQPPPFFRMLGPELVPTEQQVTDLDAIEDVIMVGYPIGLSDETNNYPVIRRGITATDPAVDFDGRAITVIDMACFPGSSGSPVFLYENGSYASKGGGIVIGSRLYLLGVLFAGPQMKVDGTIETKDIPTSTQSVPSVNVMINLGYIIKSNQIAALTSAVFSKFGIS